MHYNRLTPSKYGENDIDYIITIIKNITILSPASAITLFRIDNDLFINQTIYGNQTYHRPLRALKLFLNGP